MIIVEWRGGGSMLNPIYFYENPIDDDEKV